MGIAIAKMAGTAGWVAAEPCVIPAWLAVERQAPGW